jgi:hypothetical protein
LKRPTGVSILSVLLFFGGILLALFGAVILFLGDLIGATYGDLSAASFYVFGVIFVVLGIVNFFVAYGLWEGEAWAWTLAVAFAIIGLAVSAGESIASLASGGSASVVLVALPEEAIILYYLRRADVKAFFGRGLSHTEEVMRYYTEEVMRHLTAYPAESVRVFNAFDRSGYDGVVNYLKENDPDLTIEEAGAVANWIISNKERLVLKPGEETNSHQERKKEKSWIDKWLQR